MLEQRGSIGRALIFGVDEPQISSETTKPALSDQRGSIGRAVIFDVDEPQISSETTKPVP